MSEIKSTLLKGDCLDLMFDIPDGSVDMVMADPPYGTTACKWDAVIPFEPMWKQLKRVIKKNGAVVLMGSEPFSSYLRMSNIENYKYDWVWNRKKTTGFLNAKKRPLVQHEFVHVFYCKQCLYKPIIHNNKLRRTFLGMTKEDKTQVYGKQKVHCKNVTSEKSYPRSIIVQTGVVGNSQEKVSHPTQKPVALMEYLIKTYTNESETVLDFCMGSGTTGVACKNLNRNFIGIELGEKDNGCFELAKERIETHDIGLGLLGGKI